VTVTQTVTLWIVNRPSSPYDRLDKLKQGKFGPYDQMPGEHSNGWHGWRTMNQQTKLEQQLRRWTAAGLIDQGLRDRITAFEAGQERRASLRWPVILAMVFGGLLLAAGVTLFVAAHWSELSPSERFVLMVVMVAIFQTGGAAVAERFPALSATLHAIGTVTLGAAIFLTAQIFNLHEDWATGVLLWAVGAAAGFALLRDWIQSVALALLVPAWLISQWSITSEHHWGGNRPVASGLLLTALCYLSARIGDQESGVRRALVWIGGVALLPCAGVAIGLAMADRADSWWNPTSRVGYAPLAVAWTVAIVAPLLLAWLLRGRAAWINVVWAIWAYALLLSAGRSHEFSRVGDHRDFPMTVSLYALCGVGSVSLVAWGLREKRKERLNLGIAALAISVLFFYFDSFMGKLGRSASLLILGALCLAGGYALEITRRRLVARMEVTR
jgi:uncharacterized membrane protein